MSAHLWPDQGPHNWHFHWHLPAAHRHHIIGAGVAAGLLLLWLAIGQPWPGAGSAAIPAQETPLPLELTVPPPRLEDSMQWQGVTPIVVPPQTSAFDPVPANA